MAKRMLIDAAHPEETRVVVLSGNRLEEFDFETSTKKQIKGNIYLAKVTRVEPSLQAAFVEYGGNRHGFLAFNEIHPDYYRIPVADRQAALEAERVAEHAANAREDAERERHAHEHDRVSAPEPAEQPEEPLPDEFDSEHEEAGGAERMAYSAPGETIRAPEAEPEAFPVDPEFPDSAIAPDWREAPTTPESPPADFAEPGRDSASDFPIGHAEAQPGEDMSAEAGVAETMRDSRLGESADAHGDSIETVGGDELEETARPRARPFRHYKIQEVIKRRQIMLVQITKEERGNKGAALTTYLSLAGRYCVLMPNTPRGGGVSRKITNSNDRRRLKDLMSDLELPEGMGVIVRTAGSERSKAEIKRDFEYLMRLWEEIRDLTLRSTAPALIYEEGNLIKRSIRDLYARDIDEVIVDGEEGYRTAKSFMKMLMPSHAKRVKPYRDSSIPLFSRFQVEGPIDAIHSPIVQLRSGGYIVINPTEALVAIDVNSGRSTKERDIEETALKTNLEAAEEIARQLRLRDLAGLIVIDFIDMEEGRNQGAVERRLKESMRHDRARIQLGRISPFGLLELSRQRLRPSLLETSTAPCPHCNGTGHIRSTESTVLHVLRAIEEEGTRRRSAEVSVAVPTIIALYILNQKRDALQSAEHRYGFRVTITNDDSLIPPAYRLEQIRALTQEEIAALPVPIERAIDIDEDEDDRTEEDEETLSEGEGEALVESAELQPEPSREEPGRRRRRRRHRGGESLPEAESSAAEFAPPQEEPSSLEEQEGAAPDHAEASERGGPHEGEHKRRRRGRRGGRRRHRGHAPEGMTTTPHPEDETSAIEATPAGEGEILPTESVPVAESSDLAPRPETTTPPEPQAAPAPRLEPQIMEPLSPPPSRPTNPKRGWWQRITSSS